MSQFQIQCKPKTFTKLQYWPVFHSSPSPTKRWSAAEIVYRCVLILMEEPLTNTQQKNKDNETLSRSVISQFLPRNINTKLLNSKKQISCCNLTHNPIVSKIVNEY